MVKDDHRTMGYAATPPNKPNVFLKQHNGVKKPEPEKGSHCKNKRPPIPKRDESGKIKHNSENFRERNKEMIKSAQTKQIKQKVADTVRGNVVELERSGLLPVYIKKSKFGKVPKFVEMRKKELAAIQKTSDAPQHFETNHNGCRYISQIEREELLSVCFIKIISRKILKF